MKMEITGKKFGSFTNKKGESVAFRTLYVKTPLKPSAGIQSYGYTVDKIGVTRCVNDDLMQLLAVGDIIDVAFNQHGQAVGVELC